MTELNWFWIALALVVPTGVALAAAWPFWLKGESIFGNVVGTGVIFCCAVALIMRERIELDRTIQACIDRGVVCWPTPDPFTRYAIYACIGLVEMMVLFSVSLPVEERVRHKNVAPEWRNW